MSVNTIARRYAVALADVAVKSGEAAQVQAELRVFEQMITQMPELAQVIGNPAIPYDQKNNVLDALIAKTRPRPTTANFLRVLLKNGRLSDIPVVNQNFNQVLEERAGLVSAEVTTAQPLAAEQQTALLQKLQQITGSKVNLNFKIDPDLIGGIVTRIGSTVYDGSVKNQLQQLKEQMVKS